MTFLITGATGLIGQEIVKHCHLSNIKVHYLTTVKQKIVKTPNYIGFYWNPDKNIIDTACFTNVTTIINLAGVNIAKRWTKNYKKEILDSRINSLQLIFNSLKNHPFTVNHIISASAIGIYPSSLKNYYDENSPTTSHSFLSSVVCKWEAAADKFSELDITVSKVRIGLVLDRQNGALPKLVTPIKLGVGAVFGNGKQWQSWIHITDLARLFLHLAKHSHSGVYNGVSTNPVMHKTLIKTIANYTKRHIVLPNIPVCFLRLLLGDMHELLLSSQNVSNEKIRKTGFKFLYPNVDLALQHLLI